MNRSEINTAIKEAIQFFQKMNFPLPPYAFFTPEMWAEKSGAYQEVIDCRLGWDVTDVGMGDFKKFGRTIFTLRNGNVHNINYPKTFAQKVMHLQEDQRMPIHYHKSKMEDIINQGGGTLQVKVWPKDNNKKLRTDEFELVVDGNLVTIPGGYVFDLQPGQSICITPGTYHQFWAKKGTGFVLSMEISSTNDDLTDNIWLEENIKRFPQIVEDTKKEYLLCSEYDND